MRDWGQLFLKAANAGVYPMDILPEFAEIATAAEVAGLALFHLDLAGIDSKSDFLRIAATVMKFPEHFGKNWDAFEDCLTDFAWCEASGYVLYLENPADFKRAIPEEMKTLLNILQDAASFWIRQGKGFFVLLRN